MKEPDFPWMLAYHLTRRRPQHAWVFPFDRWKCCAGFVEIWFFSLFVCFCQWEASHTYSWCFLTLQWKYSWTCSQPVFSMSSHYAGLVKRGNLNHAWQCKDVKFEFISRLSSIKIVFKVRHPTWGENEQHLTPPKSCQIRLWSSTVKFVQVFFEDYKSM